MGWFRLFSARFTCPQSRRRETKMRNCRFYCSHFPHCEFKLVISGIFNEEGWNDDKEDNKKHCGSCCCQLSSMYAFVRNSRGLLWVTKGSNSSSLSIYIFIDVLGDILVVVMFVRLKVTYLTFFGVILTPFLSLHISTTSLSYCTANLTRRRFLMSIYGTQWCSSEREFLQNLNFDKGKCLHMGWITLHESRNLTLI